MGFNSAFRRKYFKSPITCIGEDACVHFLDMWKVLDARIVIKGFCQCNLFFLYTTRDWSMICNSVWNLRWILNFQSLYLTRLMSINYTLVTFAYRSLFISLSKTCEYSLQNAISHVVTFKTSLFFVFHNFFYCFVLFYS